MNDSKAVPAAGMHRAKTWEIGFYALNNTSTNTYMMMMMYAVSYTHLYYQQSEWRATWGGEGGGVLVNQAPHQLDLWQWICGIPTKVTSKNINGSHRKIDVENDVDVYKRQSPACRGPS